MAKYKKTGGRKKGTPNKKTEELRGIISMVLNKEFANLEETLDKIEKESGAKAKYDSICKLIGYALPQMKAIEFNAKEDQSIKIEIKKTK